VPFTCEVCGRRCVFPDLIPAVGDVLRCPHCADERPFVRPPLLVVAGTAGIGKSTLCARLAGTIPEAVLLDADIVAADLVSVAAPSGTKLSVTVQSSPIEPSGQMLTHSHPFGAGRSCGARTGEQVHHQVRNRHRHLLVNRTRELHARLGEPPTQAIKVSQRRADRNSRTTR
jgi:hypothetical protein